MSLTLAPPPILSISSLLTTPSQLSACRAPEDLQQLNEDRQTPLQLAEKLCEESKDQVVAMLVARAAELAAAALSVAADEPAH
jgi:hypothetical protein